MNGKNVLILILISIISLFGFESIVNAEGKACTMSVSSASPSTKESGKMSVIIHWNCKDDAAIYSFSVYDSKDEAGATKKNRVKIPKCVGSDYTCKPLTNVHNGSWELYNLEKNHNYYIKFKYRYDVFESGPGGNQGTRTYTEENGMKFDTNSSAEITTKTATVVISTTTGHHVPGTPTTSGDKKHTLRTTVVRTSIIENPGDFCDDELKALIHKYWNYVMLLAPILLIALLTIDGIKCVSSGSADKIKKYSNDAIKRVIATLILLASPSLISLIMNLIGFGSRICF